MKTQAVRARSRRDHDHWEGDDVRRFYGTFAPYYDGFRRVWSTLTGPAERELDRFFADRIQAGARVLELGPGTGVNIERLFRTAPAFGSYVGVDASAAMLARARRRARGDTRIDLRMGDALDLSGIPGTFDVVVSTWMISHLDDPGAAVRGALEKLSRGGSAAFLGFTAPEGALPRGALQIGARLFKARLVESDILRGFPELERMTSCAGGMATLAFYRREPA